VRERRREGWKFSGSEAVAPCEECHLVWLRTLKEVLFSSERRVDFIGSCGTGQRLNRLASDDLLVFQERIPQELRFLQEPIQGYHGDCGVGKRRR
jgi:hypothetical protein